ncbi:hypothetical protein PVK06_020326 [Gossypium arboreum]|uniref:Uncharacterized protein n=1 Tax=Gossypium arboreum TaxID=29729 RepID=A0ABR0PM22_GOSAR|nr:hypothetical protein PVK06_020326 [Gossypium arboreum]
MFASQAGGTAGWVPPFPKGKGGGVLELSLKEWMVVLTRLLYLSCCYFSPKMVEAMALRWMVPNFTAGGTIFTDAQEVAATWQIGLNLGDLSLNLKRRYALGMISKLNGLDDPTTRRLVILLNSIQVLDFVPSCIEH